MIDRLAVSALLAICFLTASTPLAIAEDSLLTPSLSLVDILFLKWLQSRNGPASTSMKPREVTLVGHPGPSFRLRIPEAYIDRAAGVEMIQNGDDKYTGFVSILA